MIATATGTFDFTAVPPSILPDRPPRSHPERTSQRDRRHSNFYEPRDNLQLRREQQNFGVAKMLPLGPVFNMPATLQS
jgi:hypothetical protein